MERGILRFIRDKILRHQFSINPYRDDLECRELSAWFYIVFPDDEFYEVPNQRRSLKRNSENA
eukprot:10768260-Prorocentrum_lima.AAC.1